MKDIKKSKRFYWKVNTGKDVPMSLKPNTINGATIINIRCESIRKRFD